MEFMEFGLDLLVLASVKMKNLRKSKNRNSNQSSTISLYSSPSRISPENTDISPGTPKHKTRKHLVKTVTRKEELASIASSSPSSSRENTTMRSTSATEIDVNVPENEADAYLPYYKNRRITRRILQETANSKLTPLDDYFYI